MSNWTSENVLSMLQGSQMNTPYSDIANAHNASIEQLRTQLAAAQKNSTYQALGEKVQEIGKLKRQLAAAQASFEALRKVGINCDIKDTSALDAAIAAAVTKNDEEWRERFKKFDKIEDKFGPAQQHIAAATKPLVDALEWLRGHRTSMEFYERIDTALAQVK